MPEWRVFSIVLAISIIDNIYKISDAIWITIGWYEFDNFTKELISPKIWRSNLLEMLHKDTVSGHLGVNPTRAEYIDPV
jgi:hypothetical protein